MDNNRRRALHLQQDGALPACLAAEFPYGLTKIVHCRMLLCLRSILAQVSEVIHQSQAKRLPSKSVVQDRFRNLREGSCQSRLCGVLGDEIVEAEFNLYSLKGFAVNLAHRQNELLVDIWPAPRGGVDRTGLFFLIVIAPA